MDSTPSTPTLQSRPVTMLIVGCGSRGDIYASYALIHPERARVVGLAEPRAHTRAKLLRAHAATIAPDQVYSDWRDMLRQRDGDDDDSHRRRRRRRLADCVVIALPDKAHKEAAVAFTRAGYHMLLEKPMAACLDDCAQITEAVRQLQHDQQQEQTESDKCERQINAVCHVLRYHAPCIRLKELIDSGLIGTVVHINHVEPVGYWHFAHSFVRGNWHREADSSSALLAKCCHDVDLLVYWMGAGKRCERVSSFGSLQHFRRENAPAGATELCWHCPCEAQCAYSAKKLYLQVAPNASEWPASVVLSAEIRNLRNNKSEANRNDNDNKEKKADDDDENEDDIEDLLVDKSEAEKRQLLEQCLQHERTAYGRCVYRMDNDVCDNQVVNMQFSDGSTATLSMVAFSKDICARKTRVYGTRGELEWDASTTPDGGTITHYDFATRTQTLVESASARPVKSRQRQQQQQPAAGTAASGEPTKMSGHGGSDYWLMDSFVEAILQRDSSLVLTDVEDSFRSHLVVFAAEHSRHTQTIVDMQKFAAEHQATAATAQRTHN